ncbi:MAG: hypothetical protein K2W94_04230 [Alphaproteobacteria bacterium]|nr:hypothetical protein [Alphaproteobacteria bacterium]
MLDDGRIYNHKLNLDNASYWMFQELPTEIQKDFCIVYRNGNGQSILQLLNSSERHRVQDVVSNVYDYQRLLNGLPYFSLDDPAAFMGHIKQINEQRAAANWADPDIESQYKWEADRLIKHIIMRALTRIPLFAGYSLLDQVPEIYPHLLLNELDWGMLRRHSIDGVPLIQYVANKAQKREGFIGDHFFSFIKAYYDDHEEISAETLNLTEISSLKRLFGSSISQPYVRDFCLRY